MLELKTEGVIIQPTTQEPEEASAAELDLGKRFFNLKTFISFGVAFAILFLLLRNVKIDFAVTFQTIRQADPLLYAVGFLIYYTGFVLRGWRWRRMLRNACAEDNTCSAPSSVPVLSQIIYVSWFANCLIPAKLGDLVRAYMLKRDTGVRFSKGMGTILAERVVDLAMLLVMLGIAGVVSMSDKLPEDVSVALELGFVLIGIAGLGLLGMRRLDHVVQRFVPERFKERYLRFYEGTLRSFHDLPFVLGMSFLIWCVEAGRLLFVTWSLGLHLSSDPLTEMLMITFIALASAALTALPVTPGGLGLVEALIVKAFAWTAAASGVQIANEMAWSIAILDRSISYGSIVALGLIVYIVSRRRK